MTKADKTAGAAHLIRNVDSFTRLKQRASGTLAILGLERLADLVQSPDGDIHYVATGRTLTGADGSVLRKLELHVHGSVFLPGESQDAYWEHELEIKRIFVLVRSEAELPPLEDEPEDEEYLVVDNELDLSALVEDEVLLDLPVAPLGLPESTGTGSGEPDGAVEGDAEVKVSPFAALASLKKQNH